MMRDLHFIRELIFALKKRDEEKTYTELSEIAREEFIDWLSLSKGKEILKQDKPSRLTANKREIKYFHKLS